jgi:hypothetical protein
LRLQVIPEVIFDSIGSRLGPVADTQFGKDAADIVTNSSFTEKEGFGYLSIGFAFGYQ